MPNIWATNSGIGLGFEAQSVQGAQPSLRGEQLRYTGDRHLVLAGPNGSGKSKRVLIPALHDLTGWSVLVNDVKGELCAMTQEHRRAAGNTIIRLNPFNVLGLGSDNFNPIAALELDEDFPDNALELAESVILLQGKEPHWAQAAQEWVAALIMYTRLVIPDGSFEDVRALLGQNDDSIRVMVLSPDDFHYKGLTLPGMIEAGIEHGFEEIGIKAARFGDITPENREIHSVISTALTQTRWLDSRPIKADLKKNPFNFGTIKDRPTTIYLILPARRLGTHSSWIRLMVASVIQKLMTDTRKPKVPVLLMLDEYAALAGGGGSSAEDVGDGFPAIARNMAMFRGYGVKLLSVWQDLAQAKRIYGEGLHSFLGNAGVIQCFAPQDHLTASLLSELCGQTTRQVITGSESLSPNPAQPMGMGITQSVNQALIPIPLMLESEIRGMDDGFSLVFTHKAKGPVRCFVPWPGDLPHLRSIMRRDPANG